MGSTPVVLVSTVDRPLQDWILDYVAEPVLVRGDLARLGPIDKLSVDEGSVTRVR